MLIRRFPLSTTLVVLAAILCGLVVGTPRADATSTLLCKGFKACQAAGYKHFAYKKHYRQMWWQMYAGHNCTNYVAYRMVKNGMPTARPWSGSGDARNWGRVFAGVTNQTPMVGSVAWWSTNHVAYVQQIIDANTIVISEDHWGGDFDWRKIVRSGGGWPTGFIHLTDETLKATAAPTIAGTPKVDTPLTASAGSWNIGGAAFGYQWLANGVAIPGATGPTYTPTAEQVGVSLSVQVTASRAGYVSGSTVSVASAAVAPGTMTPTSTPTVTGLAKVGGVLTVAGGSWQPDPASRTFAWFADGVAIPGATGTTLALGPDQLGHRITAAVTAHRAGYTDATSSSAPTEPVAPENLSVAREPALAVTAAPHLGDPVSVLPGEVSPGGVTTTYRWLRDGTRIHGADGPKYRPKAEDLGTHLSVRVTYTKPGYNPIVRTLDVAGVVTTTPHIRLTSQSHRSVTVVLRAKGLDAVRGKVTLVNAQGVSRTRTLDHGRVTFRPGDWLRAGKRTFTVVYAGSSRVDGRTVTQTLVVK